MDGCKQFRIVPGEEVIFLRVLNLEIHLELTRFKQAQGTVGGHDLAEDHFIWRTCPFLMVFGPRTVPSC